MLYDVIVAGAGPGGSSVAHDCAAAGMSVLLLDRMQFPRDKPCGGGVSQHTADLFPFSIESVIERVILGMHISVRMRPGFTRRASRPLGYLTQRRRLDTFLAEQAWAAGALFRDGAPVRGVERNTDHVVVRAGAEVYRGRTLVAADGANGPTARLAGLAVPRWLAVALEGNVTPSADFPGAWADTFGMDIGGIPGGYGWIFPKLDHLNIGVGGRYSVGPTLRSRLDTLTRFYGFNPRDVWGTRGHPLPVRHPHAPLRAGNVLLVGDAAGLVDPVSGEGIYYAVRSGQIAARHLHAYLGGQARDLSGYEMEVRRDLLPNLHDALRVHDLFHLAPAVYAELVKRSPWAWDVVCKIVRGDLEYTGMTHRVPLLGLGFDLISDAVRAVSHLRDSRDERPRPERFFTTLHRPDASAAGPAPELTP